MKINDATKVLGLVIPFTAADAKKAYRTLAMAAHPDKGGDAAEMGRLNSAYELCSGGVNYNFGDAPVIGNDGIGNVGQVFKRKKKAATVKSVVQWFAGRMLDKMGVHSRKGVTWREEKASWLLERLGDETLELKDAIESRDKEAIIKECADVANFTMMIADNARRKL